MKLIIFGANGPTGLELCHQALAAGHQVTAAVRRPHEFPFQHEALTVIHVDVMDGSPLAPAIADTDAALSALGTAYSRHEIRLYSVATKAIVAGMRASDHCRRLLVISAGLVVIGAEPLPQVRGFFQDRIILPFLRYVVGRTLYEDMLRMEAFLATCEDIDWTIMRPGRLINGAVVSQYRLDEDFPSGNVTTRPDLAAAMLAELGPDGHVHKKISPATR
jgi:putative NADH-flavin reductase